MATGLRIKQRLSALQTQLSDTDRAAAQKSAASFHAAPLNRCRAANVPPEVADLPAQLDAPKSSLSVDIVHARAHIQF